MQYAKDFEVLAELEEGVFFPTSHSHDNKVSPTSNFRVLGLGFRLWGYQIKTYLVALPHRRQSRCYNRTAIS